jgi:hypothetical protein
MNKYRTYVLVTIGIACRLIICPMAEAKSSSTSLALRQLEKKVAARPHSNATQRVKRAVLELAVERARNSLDAGLDREAQALIQDVEDALRKPADRFADRNPKAGHLAILKPLLTERKNPYLDAMVSAAREELKKEDIAWPRATPDHPAFTGLKAPRDVRKTGDKMREYFWLFAHKQSPMRGNPELLKRSLRRAHAYIDGLDLVTKEEGFKHGLYDQFAVEESFSGLYEIIELHPGLLLPSQKLAWDRSLKKAADTLWERMRKANAWNLNIETARMVGVLNLGYYTKNKEMVAKVISHVDAVLKRMRPDGAWPYHGDGNPSVNYHNNLLGSLLRIYEQTDYKPIAKALADSQWKGPVMGRTDEFWTSPFYKAYRWNREKHSEAGPEAVVALTENGFVRWLLNRDIRADRDQVAWYRADVKPRPLPDRYTIPDRNVGGPRAWYGQFTYAGTFYNPPPKMEGHETLMGAMTVDEKDGRLNSILADVTPRVWMFPEDQLHADGHRVNSAWGVLTKDLVAATTITQNYSISTAVHGITAVYRTAYQGATTDWKGRQIWIGLPDRIVGLVSLVPSKEGAEAYAVNGVLRLISGGTAGAAETKKLKRISDNHYRYGQLEILVHDTTYKSLTPIVKKYRLEKYPATELTFSNRQKEPGPVGKLNKFPADTDFRFVVEVRPTWTKDPLKVKMLGDQDLLGIQLLSGKKGWQVWLNASDKDRKCTIERKQLPRGKASVTLSDGLLGRAPFDSEFKAQVTLKPGQHALLVVSPDPKGHKPGWKSFADMIKNMPKGHPIRR